jgi:hypothetical protein
MRIEVGNVPQLFQALIEMMSQPEFNHAENLETIRNAFANPDSAPNRNDSRTLQDVTTSIRRNLGIDANSQLRRLIPQAIRIVQAGGRSLPEDFAQVAADLVAARQQGGASVEQLSQIANVGQTYFAAALRDVSRALRAGERDSIDEAIALASEAARPEWTPESGSYEVRSRRCRPRLRPSWRPA